MPISYISISVYVMLINSYALCAHKNRNQKNLRNAWAKQNLTIAHGTSIKFHISIIALTNLDYRCDHHRLAKT